MDVGDALGGRTGARGWFFGGEAASRPGVPHVSARRGTGIFEDAAVAAKQQALRGELAELAKAERALEQLLQDCALQLRQLTDHEDNQRYPCLGRHVAAGGWGTPPCPFFSLLLPCGAVLRVLGGVLGGRYLAAALWDGELGPSRSWSCFFLYLVPAHAGVRHLPGPLHHQQLPGADGDRREGSPRDEAGGAGLQRGVCGARSRPPAAGSVPGCCRARTVPRRATWGISRVQPGIAPSAFGVSPWGCLTLSGSFRGCGCGVMPCWDLAQVGGSGVGSARPPGCPP